MKLHLKTTSTGRAPSVVGSHAQSKGASYALFQFADTMAGSGSTPTASRVPVFVAAGNTILKDITIQCDGDTEENLLFQRHLLREMNSVEENRQ